MQACLAKLGLVILLVAAGLFCALAQGQQPPAPQAPPALPADTPPAEPKGVEVLARGPVHEAFATPSTEPVPTKPIAKQPPKAIEEMPPDQKPEGEVLWISGYWAWDDDRNDFLWVSGTWRVPPPGKSWVAGYWRAEGQEWQWVPGFWGPGQNHAAAGQKTNTHDVTYLPSPPAAPETAPPGEQPAPDSFFVPGSWIWHNAGYVTIGGTPVWRDAGYAWSAGYWARVQPGYVWVPAHYRWTPGGFIFIAGYWDMVVARRGVLYAPVYVNTLVVGPGFVYTPAYAVSDSILVDAMFVRPMYCHYYFGDYYGPAYVHLGFEPCIVYSRRHYDAIFVYERYEHRHDPRWESVQINIYRSRYDGIAARPPRTLVQQNIVIKQNITNVTVVNNNKVLVPQANIAAAKGIRTVPIDTATRVQAKQQAQQVQQVAQQRTQTEVASRAGSPTQPRTASLNVPHTQPVLAHSEPPARPAVQTGATTAAARPTQPGAGPGPAGTRSGVVQRPMPLPQRPPVRPPPSKEPPAHHGDSRP